MLWGVEKRPVAVVGVSDVNLQQSPFLLRDVTGIEQPAQGDQLGVYLGCHRTTSSAFHRSTSFLTDHCRAPFEAESTSTRVAKYTPASESRHLLRRVNERIIADALVEVPSESFPSDRQSGSDPLILACP